MLHAVIMAGGAGTRFWPASRARWPKQLLNLTGSRSMIQSTVDRLTGLVPPERILIVTNQQLVEPIAEQLPELPRTSILGEPCKRDTAPCIGLAAGIIAQRDPQATMVVLPADHVIEPVRNFQRTLAYAAELVNDQPSRIVTFGIRPTYAAECYGYIERAERLPPSPNASDASLPAAFRVQRFREKPNAATAAEFLATGNFYWNAGIFVWKAATIVQALDEFEPQMATHLSTIAAAFGTSRFEPTFASEFAAIQGKSIDYAVMERYRDVVVIEAAYDWDDVGNWQSLARLRGVDQDGNTIIGRHAGLNTSGSIIRTDDQHLIVTLGLKDCIVVHTPDATLVANKHDEEAMRKVTELLKQRGWTEYL